MCALTARKRFSNQKLFDKRILPREQGILHKQQAMAKNIHDAQTLLRRVKFQVTRHLFSCVFQLVPENLYRDFISLRFLMLWAKKVVPLAQLSLTKCNWWRMS